MEQPKKKSKIPQILLAVALLVLAWLIPSGEGGSLNAENLLPVAVISLAIFLLKAGAFSLALLGLKKLWKWIRKKR